MDVKLLEIDAKTGKMRLSRKALIEKPEGYVEPERKPRGDKGPRRENGNGPRRDDRRGDRGPRRDDKGPRGPRRERPAEAPEQNNEPEMF